MIFRFFSYLLIALVVTTLSLSFIRPFSATGVTTWALSYSHTFSEYLGIPWRESFYAMLDELTPSKVRIPVYWNEIEKEKGEFDFSVYDEMIKVFEDRGIQTTLVVGRRVPRWPECHEPLWSKVLTKEEEKRAILDMIIAVVERYKDSSALEYWQVENEPFLPYFGKCPFPDGEMLDTEISLVRILDDNTPIVVTDSGELSVWYFAAKRGDVFGTTMYRTVWSDAISPYVGYFTYPLPPQFFWLKANIVQFLLGEHKKMIVSELQAEPWAPGSIRDLSVEEQNQSLSFEHLLENISYAKKVGFPEVYLWGVEWWYFMKTEREDTRYWDAMKELLGE